MIKLNKQRALAEKTISSNDAGQAVGVMLLVENDTPRQGNIADIRPAHMPFSRKESWPKFLKVCITDGDINTLKSGKCALSRVDVNSVIVIAEHRHNSGCSCDIMRQVINLTYQEFVQALR